MVSGVDRWIQRASGQTIVAVSAELAAILTERRPKQRIVVIENGVDIEGLRGQVRSSGSAFAKSGATHIGFVGRLVAVKRVDLFLEMARRLLSAKPSRGWAFEVIGEGPERENLVALCSRLEMAGHVTFHGHREDIANYMSGLDVLVMCSDHEGMPMAALEAAALGVPTVAHAVGGLIDVVPKELQVTRHDAPGYSEAVLRALQSDTRETASNHAKRVLENYSAVRNAERTVTLYRELLRCGANG